MTGGDGDTVQAPIASWTVRIAGRLLAGLLTAAALAEAADLYRAVGIVVFAEQRLLALLGLALGTLYILKGAKPGPRLDVPWYDALAATAGVLVCFYLSWHYERIFEELYSRPRDALLGGAVILALVAEGVRRSAGPVLFIFLASFFTLGLVGHFIPGQFQGRDVDFDRLVIYLSLDSNALVGIPLTVATTIVISFIYFGNLLDLSGGSRFFTDISTALMGRYRGGSAKIAVTASSLFGSISGSATSNVVSTGVITIPLMKKGGYPAHTAGAIEAVASTGGQLMPPMMGAAAFVMAEFLQISYQEVVLAALIPAILYYVALFIQADLFAAREGIARVDEDSIPPRWPVFRAGWPYVVPFAVVILCLFYLNLRPETSALWAAGSLVPIGLLIGYQGERMRWWVIFTVLAKTGALCVQVLMISCMAGIIIGVLNITGLGFALTQAIIHLAGGQTAMILVLAALISIVLGMGMPTLGVYLLLATLVTPSMVEVGIPPMAAHLFALYFGMLSLITPPVAVAAFTAATVAESDFLRTGFAAVHFGWTAYVVPFLFVLAPELLMQGSAVTILHTSATAVIGVWLVSAGFMGFFARPLGVGHRVLFMAAGALLFFPAGGVSYGIWTDVAGACLAGVLVITGGFRRERG
ncbi:MAG: TRAP transporter fused permease subunit [Deltaproteobacteria bacterium]|nr:TRAP transporter fused permease subunit [Deltaproteobacteria bacterium]